MNEEEGLIFAGVQSGGGQAAKRRQQKGSSIQEV